MKNNLLNILKKEIRETFRDKKSLCMMLIIPFMIPLIIIGMSALFDSKNDVDLKKYNKIGFAYNLSEPEKSIAKEMEIEVIEKSLEELKDDYKKGEIYLYVTKENNTYYLNGNDTEDFAYASSLVESYLNSYKEYEQSLILTSSNINPSEFNNILNIDYNITTEENFYASYIINYALMFIIMAITISATYPATDTTAGEKERGTLETLLTFPIKSKDIIIGKYLSVSLSSVITGIISFILTFISLIYVGKTFSIYEGVNLVLSFKASCLIILLIIVYSLLISGLCIAIASRCKTFKEAQSALTPLTFVSFFPGMIAFMVGIKSTTVLSLIPFLNINMMFDDIIKNNISILNLALTILSTIIIIVIVLRLIIKEYKSERVLFKN